MTYLQRAVFVHETLGAERAERLLTISEETQVPIHSVRRVAAGEQILHEWVERLYAYLQPSPVPLETGPVEPGPLFYDQAAQKYGLDPEKEGVRRLVIDFQKMGVTSLSELRLLARSEKIRISEEGWDDYKLVHKVVCEKLKGVSPSENREKIDSLLQASWSGRR